MMKLREGLKTGGLSEPDKFGPRLEDASDWDCWAADKWSSWQGGVNASWEVSSPHGSWKPGGSSGSGGRWR